jgi:hypothetical protein
MSPRGKTEVSFIVCIIAVVSVGGYFTWSKMLDEVARGSSMTSLPAQTEWKTYENIRYHYKIKYPATVTITNVEEMDPSPVNESGHVNLSLSPSTSVTIFAASNYVSNLAEKYKKLVALDLQSFVQEMWRYQKANIENGANGYLRSRKLGEITEGSFSATQAFTFTTAGPLTTGLGGPYAPDLYATYKYIFLDQKGTKLILNYAVNDRLSATIVKTFEFRDSI